MLFEMWYTLAEIIISLLCGYYLRKKMANKRNENMLISKMMFIRLIHMFCTGQNRSEELYGVFYGSNQWFNSCIRI